MTRLRRSTHGASLAALLATAASAFSASAQQVVTAGSEEFDRNRAVLFDSTIYAPFHVTDESRPLRDALSDGTLQDETLLLVIEHSKGRLALVRDQMSYHHVAQGEFMGEPWMVSF